MNHKKILNILGPEKDDIEWVDPQGDTILQIGIQTEDAMRLDSEQEDIFVHQKSGHSNKHYLCSGKRKELEQKPHITILYESMIN